MHHRTRLLAITASACLATAALVLDQTPARAAEPVRLTLAEADGREVQLVFGPDRRAPDALTIVTRRVGNPGARLSIWIDRDRMHLLRRILTDEDCRFDDQGARCTLRVAGATAEYDRFVYAFRKGRTAHVTVENANLMEMGGDLSLQGFTRAYGG